MTSLSPFHLAIPVSNLADAETFYTCVLGCETGRRSEKWIDFNFFGHQLVCHEVDYSSHETPSNPVDGHDVPVPHFGVVLNMSEWRSIRDRLLANEVNFLIEPHVRFRGQPGEQATLFFFDPSGNAIEFKGFSNIEQELFKTTK